jgi:hypothetical protein
MLPEGSKLKLYPFTLKKGANIYGIIFGASHPRAVEKFLRIVWKRNGINGEANFDIDNDAAKAQATLFGPPMLTKIEKFQETVRRKILSGELTNNHQLLDFTFEEAHLGSHASECVRALKREGLIEYDGSSPLVTYESVYKKKHTIEYKLNDAQK